MFTYQYPRPSLTADIALFDKEKKTILLIKRGREPFKGCWAFPGGFFDMEDRDIEETAARELEEETGLKGIALRQCFVASREGRDPRGRTVSVIFAGIVDSEGINAKGSDDASEARWFSLADLPPLAFDHKEVLDRLLAMEWLADALAK